MQCFWNKEAQHSVLIVDSLSAGQAEGIGCDSDREAIGSLP